MTTSKTKIFFSKELRELINGKTPKESLLMSLPNGFSKCIYKISTYAKVLR